MKKKKKKFKNEKNIMKFMTKYPTILKNKIKNKKIALIQYQKNAN